MNETPRDGEDAWYGLRLSGADPAALSQALLETMAAAARDPFAPARAALSAAVQGAEAAVDAARVALGGDGEPPVAPAEGDARFADRAWRENPLLRLALSGYLIGARFAREAVEDAEVPEATRQKARFLLELAVDAAAPSNVPWLNPVVVKEAFDTGGRSLARGFANFLRDLADNRGLPSQVDREAFVVGRELAATPGRVVLRNDLIELIAYEPQTETVFAEPVVYSPPWINKYYMMDLAPGRSWVEHAVRQGFTVFAISYRNPDASMAEVTLDDYLRDGWLAAVDRASELTGSPRVNVVGVCLGGTLTVIGLALLAARGEAERIGWAALLNTLVDFAEPGEIGVFTDEAAVRRIEARMARRGYLSGPELSNPFTWMRANDLVWRYVVSGWYMGKRPPAFDILAWNADETRLPAAMHSQYLRACYLENRLAGPDALELLHMPIDVGRVQTPLYVLAAENDHIAPWRSAYRTTQLVGGEARFVLSSSGHIASLVNPPGQTKARYATRSDCPADPDTWRADADVSSGSWWEHWSAWAAKRSGDRVPPAGLPRGEPAPGFYVRG